MNREEIILIKSQTEHLNQQERNEYFDLLLDSLTTPTKGGDEVTWDNFQAWEKENNPFYPKPMRWDRHKAFEAIKALSQPKPLTEGEVIDKLKQLFDESGRDGCTYGDTNYDSLSVCYGNNQAILNIIANIKDFLFSQKGWTVVNDELPKLPQQEEQGEVNIIDMLKTIQNETRPIDGHTDPKAINDLWSEVFGQLKLNK